MKTNHLSLALLVLFHLQLAFVTSQLSAAISVNAIVQEEKSIAEFREYVSEKLQGLSDAQLDAIVKAVDSNGDGIISDDEFENRMDAIEAALSETPDQDDDSEQMEKKNDQSKADEAETKEAETKEAAADEADADEAEAEAEADEGATKLILPGEEAVGDLKNRADVLLITSSELAESWEKFAIWKTQTGRPTKVISVDEIKENFEGEDIQQKIRQCCLKHIADSGTRFVILGGDSSDDEGCVPDRDTDHSECKMLPYDDIPTDLYYISEKNWDANDDGVYGSFEDDMEAVSYTNPNACIGRIPVRTPADVLAYVNKVIAYESKYPVGQFANRMVYTCPEEVAYPKLETSVKNLSENWSGNIAKFFGNSTPWDDQKKGDHDLTPATWAKMINNRDAAKIHMHGHGILPMWVLEGHSELTSSTVKTLENKNAYPIITTVSCLTGQFDNRKDPCIAESMIRQADAGAIAVLAPCREGVPFMLDPAKDFRLMMTEGKMDGTTTAYTKFWTCALKDRMTLGEAFKQVKIDMEADARKDIGFHMLQCELNLLGDPTLDPRPEPPVNFEGRVRVSGSKIVARGFAGAKLCVWDGEGHYEIVTAKSGRTTRIDLGEKTGTYSVAAFGSGFNTWVKEGLVVE